MEGEKIRKIIHIDMDAFYASIEQRDNPKLKGKPIIVGGPPNTRSVVATCSYEARKYGIHSAMSSNLAAKLCPHAIFVSSHFDVYRKVSKQIRDIFKDYTDLVEPLSLDEAFLDVTMNKKNISSATTIAMEIKQRIQKITELTASAGVSINKFIAKVASDFNKPDGLTVVPPFKVLNFIEKLDIGKFYGIGKVTEQKMRKIGINTGADLKKLELNKLVKLFGKVGKFYYNISRGIDNRPVNPNWIRKSLGSEITLKIDIDNIEEITDILWKIALKLEKQLKKLNLKGKTVNLKIRYYDFETLTRSITLYKPIYKAEDIISDVKLLLNKTDAGLKKVRLLGISISKFENDNIIKKTYSLFDTH